jgi:hypothetical protein
MRRVRHDSRDRYDFYDGSVTSTIEAPLLPIERWWPWILRGLWLVLPFTVGLALSDAVSTRSAAVRLVAVGVGWAWWAVGLLAVLVPHPAGLVAVRTGSVAVVAAALWSGFERPSVDATSVAALSASLVVCAAVLWSETGHWCVNGPAYANERRFLLRAPAVLLLGPIPVAGVLLAAGTIAGPLLLASKSWVIGGCLVFGVAVAVIVARALYAQCRRFLVFVPAGLVVHDFDVLREPVLFKKQTVELLRAAPAESDSLDLTANASGLALEVLLAEKVEITKVKNSRDAGETGRTARFLVVPTLPGRLLRTAAARGLRVG